MAAQSEQQQSDQQQPAARREPGRRRGGRRAAGLALAVSVAAGIALAGPAAMSGAATTGGTLQGWGDNLNGQLGNGTATNSDKPVTVDLPVGTTVTAVATGGKHSLALTSTGQVLAWGDNYNGQLGDGTTTDSHTPVPVKLPPGVVATGVAAGEDDSLAVTSTGQVYSWGDNFYGQLGDGGTTQSDLPVQAVLPAGTKVVAVRASYNYCMALTAGGHVLTWGYDGSGQLGNGYLTASEVPARIDAPAGTTVTQIANGGYDGLALTSTGRLLAWGSDQFGQLGDGSRKSALKPVAVKLPPGTRLTAIGAGSQHSLALTSAGRVLAWGWNAYGQLGDGTTTSSDLPVQVRIPAGVTVTAVSAGGGFSLALTSKGQILTWGNNGFGQLGDGTTTSSDVPVTVALSASLLATALAAGPTPRHSLAIVAARP
jgi:alpha-tubulin suppressor-like RCC1 family protein